MNKLQKLTKKCATLFFIIFSPNCILSYFGFNIVVHTATIKATCTNGQFSSNGKTLSIILSKTNATVESID